MTKEELEEVLSKTKMEKVSELDHVMRGRIKFLRDEDRPKY